MQVLLSVPAACAEKSFDSKLQDVFEDIVLDYQDSISSAFVRDGLDLSDPSVRAVLSLPEPWQKVENMLQIHVENMVSSHPGLAPVLAYERFQPLLQSVIATQVCALIEPVACVVSIDL